MNKQNPKISAYAIWQAEARRGVHLVVGGKETVQVNFQAAVDAEDGSMAL